MDNAVAATHRPFVVVLTGGPMSGKSSALALLRDRLTTRGFQVLTVPEMATHLLTNCDGFQPEWVGTEAQVRMQRIFVDFQLAQETAFHDIAKLHPTKRPVLILDACSLSPKLYLSDEQWQQALNLPGMPALTEEDLIARYDLVIQMTTCAHGGHYEWGPGSNNPGRYHNREQAKEHDQRSLEVFSAHPQLRVVPHFADFEDKIERVVQFVNDALHVEGLAGKRRRRKCCVKSIEELSELVALPTTISALVTSTFLDDDMQHSVRRHQRVSSKLWLEEYQRLHAESAKPTERSSAIESALSGNKPVDGVEHAAEVMYERRAKEVFPPGSGLTKPCLTRKIITMDDYYLALQSRSAPAVITKFVLRFIFNSNYYELFFNLDQKDLVLDFGAHSPEGHPGWLQFIGTKDLTREDSFPQPPCQSILEGPTKKRRFLRAHSTEEAALGPLGA